MRIVEEGIADLAGYSTVPISFQIESRVRLGELVRDGAIIEEAIPARWKNYDCELEERPTALDRRFGIANWGVLASYDGGRRVGGAIIARDTPGFDMLRGRSDLAVLADLRVCPDFRGLGVGRALFQASMEWARAHGCVDLFVETQDTNVAACRFYAAMGCTLESADPAGYGPDSDEAKLIWRIDIAGA